MRLADVHPVLKEMLAVFEALRRLGFPADDIFVVPEAIEYGSDRVVPATLLRTQGKEFAITAGDPYPKEKFVDDWEAAGKLWNAGKDSERGAIYERSIIKRKGCSLLLALEKKGITPPCIAARRN